MDQNISNDLPHKIHQEVLHEIIKNNLSKTLDQYDIVYSAGSAKGDNYVGIIYRVEVKEIESGTSKLNLILKLAPTNAKRRADFTVSNFFKLEIKFYENVYPMFHKYQVQKGLDVGKDGFHQVPFCYKALIDEPNEGLYFEDLKAKGFVMFDRFQEVTKDQVFLVMKALAKMHALSFSMKNENPKALETYHGIKDGWIVMGEGEDAPMTSWYEHVKTQTVEVIERSSNKELIEKVKHFVKNDFVESLKWYHSREQTEPYAVICHGDVSFPQNFKKYYRN